jgi:acyl-CoA thioesterase FadM
MAFHVTFPTRHTDTFAATGFVHAGVLLALTELAYAAFEEVAGVRKPEQVVAVELRTRAEYLRPLPWREGAELVVRCLSIESQGLTQAYEVRSAVSGRLVARIEHDWVWLDITTGRAVPLDEGVRERFAAAEREAGGDD